MAVCNATIEELRGENLRLIDTCPICEHVVAKHRRDADAQAAASREAAAASREAAAAAEAQRLLLEAQQNAAQEAPRK